MSPDTIVSLRSEFVLNEKDIYRYNCDKKVDFIKRGLGKLEVIIFVGLTP